MTYKLSDFDYDLPEALIAQEPAQPRDHARLLIYDRASKKVTDDYFYNLPEYLSPRTTLVTNNSKVEKCRLLFDGGKKEIFVLDEMNNGTVRAMVRPGKKFNAGKTVKLTSDITALVLNIDDEGIRTLRMNPPPDDKAYDPYKRTPFPPYIKQNEKLAEEYQTVYAKTKGSKAAPTAGLHFTDTLLKKLKESGIDRAEITLHVGLGTFAPVKAENIEDHTMHSEWYAISKDVAQKLNAAKHITAVGSTSLRVLESSRQKHPGFNAETGETDIFIRPGYTFQMTDSLITNFHLPKSTLLMLIAAFMGFDEMHRVYQYAIEKKYRFYSFGDAMLIQ